MGETVRDVATLLGILVSLVTIIGAIIKLNGRYEQNRKKLEKFGKFFSAKELRGALSVTTKNKLCSECLLKHSTTDWNDFYLWTENNQRVLKRIKEHERTLIVGVSGLGKTRLVIETLRFLTREDQDFKNAFVIALKDSSETGQVSIIGKTFRRKWERIVLVFDDLERFIGKINIADLVTEFTKISESIRVIATCRTEQFCDISDQYEITTLFSKKDRVDLSRFTQEEGMKLAVGAKKPFPKDFYGTADQIILDKLKKEEIYRKLSKDERAILKSAKLLRTCLISSFSGQLLNSVWKYIFLGSGDWDASFNKVSRSYGFLLITSSYGSDRFSLPDAYLDRDRGIVDDYPSYNEQILEDAEKLKKILFEYKLLDELNSLGFHLCNSGLYEKALSCFDFIARQKPEDVDSWLSRGYAFIGLGRYEEAIGCFSKAIEFKPGSSSAWNNKGSALDSLGRYDEAISCYNKAIELKPDSASAWNNKGVSLDSINRYNEAIDCFNKAIELKPDYALAWKNKCFALGCLQRYEEIRECLNHAYESNPCQQ
jgi:tetratricopeptide (TPR) repeat protein